MEEVLKNLELLSQSWKAQFETRPDIPLKWSVDAEGLLWLDGNWVCPVKKVISGDSCITPVSMELNLEDGSLTVIITSYGKEYEVSCMERGFGYKKGKVQKLKTSKYAL